MTRRSSLVQRFSLLSAVALGALAVVLGVLLSRELEALVLERARLDTAQMVIQQAPIYLAGLDLRYPPADSAAFARLAAQVRHIGIGSHIARVKIWSRKHQ